ncbi:MAG: TetR/AcrR family transcriptional regulator [Acidimicrobiia bacterium]
MRTVPESICGRLEPAAAVFAGRGFDDTRMEDLAEATGVPRATLYYYFAGKEEILGWLLGRTLDEVASAVALATGGDGTARERLEGAVLAMLGVMATHPESCRALAADSGRVSRMPELADAIQSGFHHPVRRLLAEGESDGSLRSVTDPETCASAVYGAVLMSGLHYLVVDNRMDPDRVGPQLTMLLFSGLDPVSSDKSRSAGQASG